MRRNRSRSLGALASEDGKILGVSPTVLLLGIGAAGALAYFSSGSADTDTTPDTSTPTGNGTPTKTTPTKTTPTKTTPTSPGLSPASVKPYRKTLVGKASPQLLVFVNSFGGEGIFDRLRNVATVLDGNGLNRIATLSNGEWAGWATGNEWIAQDSLQTYTQVYTEIGKIGYNYWIQKSQTTQVHADAAQFGLTAAFGGFDEMSEAHRAAIRQFYFDNYTF